MPIMDNDRPTDDDRLDFRAYSRILSSILRTAETPITVGVFGSWGSGKTSLLSMLMKDVAQVPASVGSPVAPVWFNPWQYHRAEDLQRAFILRVLDAFRYKPEESDESASESKTPDEGRTKVEEKLALLEAALHSTVELRVPRKLSFDLTKIGKDTLQEIMALLCDHFPLLAATGILMRSAKRIVECTQGRDYDPAKMDNVITREIVVLLRKQLRTFDEFHAAFAELVELRVENAQGRMFVFVDDLDRCLPEQALEILEAIKLFFDAKGCVFVIGMDRDVVAQGIEFHYKHLALTDGVIRSDLIPTGDSYLQKMIQLPFYLPPLSTERVEKYIKGKVAEAEPLPACGPRLFALGLPPNPRQVNLALNSYRLFRAIAEQRIAGGTLQQIAWPLLIKTVIIQTQAEFKDFYQAWQVNSTLISQLEAVYRQTQSHGPSIADSAVPAASAPIASGMDPQLGQSELLSKFQKTDTAANRRLRNLLSEGREWTADTPAEERELFQGLAPSQIRDYIYLVSTEGTTEHLVETTDKTIESLLSGDPARVKDAVAAILESEATKSYRDYLQRALASISEGGMGLATASRIQAGNALAYLGDNRQGVADPPKMLPIAGGEFLFGRDKEKRKLRSGFEISMYPITNAQYQAFINDSEGYPVPGVPDPEPFERPYCWDPQKRVYPEGRMNHPVVLVSLDDAKAYCAWLSKRGGGQYSLPTEEQWERAARGIDGREYPWEGGFSGDKSNTAEGRAGGTTAVGSYPDGASADGMLDCAGNVWEWTSTQTQDRYQCCGGSWAGDQDQAKCWTRKAFFKELRLNVLGFRVVRNAA